jgi:hypothetical protein
MMNDIERDNLRRWLRGRNALELAEYLELTAEEIGAMSRAAENFTRRAAAALVQEVHELLERAHRL